MGLRQVWETNASHWRTPNLRRRSTFAPGNSSILTRKFCTRAAGRNDRSRLVQFSRGPPARGNRKTTVHREFHPGTRLALLALGDSPITIPRAEREQCQMAVNREEIITCLNDLIETCRDGEKGFQTAAVHTTDENLKTYFRRCSSQQAQFASKLQAKIR